MQATASRDPLVAVASPQISSTDLQRLAELLALAAERGAFPISEFEDVGNLYRRVNEFLQSSKQSA